MHGNSEDISTKKDRMNNQTQDNVEIYQEHVVDTDTLSNRRPVRTRRRPEMSGEWVYH